MTKPAARRREIARPAALDALPILECKYIIVLFTNGSSPAILRAPSNSLLQRFQDTLLQRVYHLMLMFHMMKYACPLVISQMID